MTVADEERAEKSAAGGGDKNPITHLLDIAKDVPWYYYAGAGVAGLAVYLGFFRQQQPASSAATTSPAGDQIPYADTTSPLDYAFQGAADGAGSGTVSSTPSAPPGSSATPTPRTYTVKGGDTLEGIARYFGNGETWQQIYQDNQAIINTTAAKYGHTTNQQNWIYAGEVLTLRN